MHLYQKLYVKLAFSHPKMNGHNVNSRDPRLLNGNVGLFGFGGSLRWVSKRHIWPINPWCMRLIEMTDDGYFIAELGRGGRPVDHESGTAA
jgi:hypothetical protein